MRTLRPIAAASLLLLICLRAQASPAEETANGYIKPRQGERVDFSFTPKQRFPFRAEVRNPPGSDELTVIYVSSETAAKRIEQEMDRGKAELVITVGSVAVETVFVPKKAPPPPPKPPPPSKVFLLDAAGKLGPGDSVSEDRWFDRYVVSAAKGDAIAVIMEAGQFDAFLNVVLPGWKSVSADDRGGDGSALAAFTMPEDGDAAIYAMNWVKDVGGAYRIRAVKALSLGEAKAALLQRKEESVKDRLKRLRERKRRLKKAGKR